MADTGNERVEGGEKSPEAAMDTERVEEGPKLLDLAFAMDCTGSMASYIHQAQQNIRLIVEEIVSKEKADVRLALVEYRDHPPQDSSFVTRKHDFTNSVGQMKKWLDGSSASGGGDGPEAVADALNDVLNLEWRPSAVKICVFIADAPPHGLGAGGDGFPNGCPKGLDPMKVTNQIAEKSIKIYMVGCEPSINPYMEFFMALCHLTGGQYVPLRSARVLAKVIVGGAQEEISLQKMMEEVNREVLLEAQQQQGEIDSEELATRVHSKLKSQNHRTRQLTVNNAALPQATVQAQKWSHHNCMEDVRKEYSESSAMAPRSFGMSAAPPSRSYKKKTKKAKGGGGFLSGWFGSSKAEEDEEEEVAQCDAPPFPGGSAAPAMAPMPMSTNADDYVTAECDVDYQQAQRMVQTSMMSNNLKSRMKKH